LNRRWAVAGLSRVATVALTLTGTGIAQASSSSHKTTVRTYVESDTITLHGLGKYRGWLDEESLTHSTRLSPRLAWKNTGTWFDNSQNPPTTTWSDILVGSTDYQNRDGGPYKKTRYTKKQLAAAARADDPMYFTRVFLRLRGVHHVGPGHYRVTGSPAALRSFVNLQLAYDSAYFARVGIKKLTLDLWIDSKGRPTHIHAAGASAVEKAVIQETFRSYDKPLTIKAP
jgi:hypothetical protein